MLFIIFISIISVINKSTLKYKVSHSNPLNICKIGSHLTLFRELQGTLFIYWSKLYWGLHYIYRSAICSSHTIEFWQQESFSKRLASVGTISWPDKYRHQFFILSITLKKSSQNNLLVKLVPLKMYFLTL